MRVRTSINKPAIRRWDEGTWQLAIKEVINNTSMTATCVLPIDNSIDYDIIINTYTGGRRTKAGDLWNIHDTHATTHRRVVHQ